MSTPKNASATEDTLTINETDIDAAGNACLVIRCKDRNGVFLPCFTLPLNREQLAEVYAFPLEFTLRHAGH